MWLWFLLITFTDIKMCILNNHSQLAHRLYGEKEDKIMRSETIFDGLKGWTNEMSRYGLSIMMLNTLTGVPMLEDAHESTVNQLLTFMVRDLERARA